MAANRERLVAESNMENKMKNQKAKSKLSEGRRQLSNVRVIQRNLVYIVGLPLNLSDESLLEQQDYFGQYGKVLKVSMSRTAAGVIQQFPNSTCSVYVYIFIKPMEVLSLMILWFFSLKLACHGGCCWKLYPLLFFGL